jgi:predicted enzyme related to lactoylglutathione lyase
MILRSAPYFPVPDVEAAVNHYQSVFGFETEYVAGKPAQFGIVRRDGLGIMFRRVSDAKKIVPNEPQGGTWDAFFWVSDVQSLYDELHKNGADIVYGPILQAEYAMMEIAVRDPNGYVLGFGQDWREAPAAARS